MESLMLVDDFNYGHTAGAAAGPAKGDPNLLPLGLIRTPPPGTTTTAAPARQAPSAAPAAPVFLTAAGCPKTLPPPPAGPPVMVLFPATLHLSMFLVPPPPATLASVALTLISIPGAWRRNFSLNSIYCPGRSIPHPSYTYRLTTKQQPYSFPPLSSKKSVLGIAILGEQWASLAFAAALALSTLWRHGWWLYMHPECAPVLFILAGSTADIALGFVLSSLLQIYRSPPPEQQQPDSQSQPLADAAPVASQQGAPGLGQQAGMWDAVTPPGLRTRRM
ncbi:unnamed protein product [Scytosiphon promiscuus]